jgi:hypothetical protein
MKISKLLSKHKIITNKLNVGIDKHKHLLKKKLTSASIKTISTENGKSFLLKSFTTHNLITFALTLQEDFESLISEILSKVFESVDKAILKK